MELENEYCQMEGCESPAVEEVEVSVSKEETETRLMCFPCKEAYDIGAQHAQFRAIRNLNRLGFHAAASVLDLFWWELDEEEPSQHGPIQQESAANPDLELKVVVDDYSVFSSAERRISVADLDQIAGEVKDNLIHDPPCVLLRDAEGNYYSLVIHGAHSLQRITRDEADEQFDLWDREVEDDD